MTRPRLGRLAALITALGLALSLVSPVAAWDPYDVEDRWRAAPLGGYLVYVCALPNFDKTPGATGNGWDFTLGRHARVQDALNEFESTFPNVSLNYVFSNNSCNGLDGSSLTRLEIGWGYDPNDRALAVTDITEINYFCVSHCVEAISIRFDDDDQGQGNDMWLPNDIKYTWYVNSSNDIPSAKYSFEEVMVHELGHASALHHVSNTHAIMCTEAEADPDDCDHSFTQQGPGFHSPSFKTDDINGINALW